MHKIKILHAQFETHDTKRFITTKPQNYKYEPGQATEVSINLPDWEDKKRPFTYTSLPDEPVLEFTIKKYPDHNGVTEKMHELEIGTELLIDDPWGALTYKGKGTFIAGGAGITPFLAVLRDLQREGKLAGNKLIFANKTEADVICQRELQQLLQNDAKFILSREEKHGYDSGHITWDELNPLIEDDSQVYVCGPPAFEKSVTEILSQQGIDSDNISLEE